MKLLVAMFNVLVGRMFSKTIMACVEARMYGAKMSCQMLELELAITKTKLDASNIYLKMADSRVQSLIDSMLEEPQVCITDLDAPYTNGVECEEIRLARAHEAMEREYYDSQEFADDRAEFEAQIAADNLEMEMAYNAQFSSSEERAEFEERGHIERQGNRAFAYQDDDLPF